MKEFKKPEGYTCPFYTSTKVAEILGLNLSTVIKRKEKMATEVVPGTFFWSEEDIMKLVEEKPRQGRSDFYKFCPNYKKSHANKENNS